ncbi:MAG: fibronectin type III domain-containing protein [Actinomycetota bacterium]
MRRSVLILMTAALFVATVAVAGATDEVAESGPDRRVSQTGPDDDTGFDADAPAIAHDPSTGRSLVVWTADGAEGDDEDEVEVWARLLDADGEPIGEQQQLSGQEDVEAVRADVAYDAVTDRFLVTWIAVPDDSDDHELRSRVVGNDGVPIGVVELVTTRLTSDVAVDGENGPAMAADPTGGAVVTWVGREGLAGFEVVAVRIDADGRPAGDEQQVSISGPAMDPAFAASFPAVTADPSGGYVVAWTADSDAAPLVDDELEVYARRLGADAVPTGDQVRVSAAGPDGDVTFLTEAPDVAVTPAGEVLVVWEETSPGPKSEVVVRPLGADLVPTADASVISTGGATADAQYPVVVHNVVSGEYLVAWSGDPAIAPTVDGELEIWAQRLAADLTPQEDPLRVSSMGPDGDTGFGAQLPAVAHAPEANDYAVVWSGDSSGDGLVQGETEIFVQPLTQASPPTSPTNVAAGVPGPGRVQLSWEAPEFDGGSDVTGYRISTAAGPLTAVAGSVTSVVITGLEPGDYTLGVEALNVNGASEVATSEVVMVSATGYWLLETDGTVYPFGNTEALGSLTPTAGVTAVDIVAVPNNTGYWVLDTSGTVSAFGSAVDHGSVVADSLLDGEVVTTMSSTPTGGGYWIFTNIGRAVAFGDATDIPDLVDLEIAALLNGPIVDSVATPSGLGYYMIGSDGGVFSLGDAEFYGSMGGVDLNQPVNGIVPDPDGVGYWLVAGDGGVFAFEADFVGSMGSTPLNAPVVGMVAYGDAYLMVGADGGVFNFSDLPFVGSLGDTPPDTGIVAIAA